MSNDYLLFIHGVANREPVRNSYADFLCSLIKTKCDQLGAQTNLIPVPLFWGDVSVAEEISVLQAEKDAAIYAKFDLKQIRERLVLPFVGDAVSYLSRALGGLIIEALKATAQSGFRNFEPESDNRLHLITHSLGTVILFDILFADRWDDPSVFGAASAMELRDIIFGAQPTPLSGLVVRSIHTMGSPLDIFSLLELIPATAATQSSRTTGSVIDRRKLNAESVAIQNNPNAAPASQKQVTDLQRLIEHDASYVDNKVADFVASADLARQPDTHAISKNLNGMLSTSFSFTQKKIQWCNYAHPGDLVAYPISALMANILGPSADYLNIQDFLVEDGGPQFLENIELLAISRAGEAHQSYWKSHFVAGQIAQSILSA